MSDEFDLKRSKEIVGAEYEVLLDAHGNIIDGFHRLEKDPNWPTKTLGKVKTEKDRILYRIHANQCRRDIPVSERRKDLEALAREFEKEGVPKDQICKRLSEIVPFTPRYIQMLLPDEYKRDYKRVVEEMDIPEQEKSEIISQLEQEPKPRILLEFTGEDWECPICGAVYKLHHATPSDHKLELVEEGKSADKEA